jgi:sterol desaturase/sphingolipid hydroxylase (fatty acid hydroxylase superfamily)
MSNTGSQDRGPLGSLTSWSIFALLVGGLPAAAVALRRSGVSADALAFGAMVVACLTLAVLERLAPYARDWNRARGDVGLDALHTAAAIGLGAVVPAAVTAALTRTGAEAAGAGVWPAEWPLAAQVSVALACADLGKYVLHRWSHESAGILWRIHAVHHDTPRLYWLNAGRFHPLNVALNLTLGILPIRLLGVPAEVVFATSLTSLIHNFITHANVDLRLGALNWVFSGPELHRWHHAQRVADANHNYGGTLILWDVLCGTRRLPSRALAAEAVGLEGGASLGSTYRAHLLHPFRCPRQDRRGALCALLCRPVG